MIYAGFPTYIVPRLTSLPKSTLRIHYRLFMYETVIRQASSISGKVIACLGWRLFLSPLLRLFNHPES
jgi:hypothetical protein